jgi:hypothetical protein
MKRLSSKRNLLTSTSDTNLESRVMLSSTPAASLGTLSISNPSSPRNFISVVGRAIGTQTTFNGIATQSTNDPAEFAQVGLDLRAQDGGLSAGNSSVVLDETGRDGDADLQLVADSVPGGAAFSSGISQIGSPPVQRFIDRVTIDLSRFF